MEKYGTGFVRIRAHLEDEAPELRLSFEEDPGAFWVTLENATAAQEKASGKKAGEGLSEGLTSLYEAIEENPGSKAKELGPMLDRPIKTLERQISTLTDKGLIERRGSRKTGGYFVKPTLSS